MNDKLAKEYEDKFSGCYDEVTECVTIDNSTLWLWIEQKIDEAKPKWIKTKPDKPCLFVARYNKKDEHPDLYYAVYDEGILCVTDTYQNYNCTMEEFADCEFCIIELLSLPESPELKEKL